MGTVHHLPNAANAHQRILEKLVNDVISQHPDEIVAARWATMARQTLSRYPGPPMPTQPVLNLDAVKGLSSEQARAIQLLTEDWLQCYFDDVGDQLMQMHRDLLTLQKTVAELEAGNNASPKDV